MININVDHVENLQLENKKILLDLFGSWCEPCKKLIPILESFEKEYPNVTFVKMDISQNMDFVRELGVNSVPTVLIYNGNELIDKLVGVQPITVYREILDKLK